ncbi:MAG TPA: polynucleotide kinase-phosphatase, partial [Baekduia sp.]|nr:polynucleotide kinase-phosphatase [Baekduia sp.]
MRIEIPDPSLVVLMGPSGSGKSTFGAAHFKATEVVSSDFCRGLVADDENDQAASEDAFAVLHFIAGRRLAQPRLTVVDATSVERSARKPLVELARAHDLFPVAIVLDLPERECLARNALRPDRDFGAHVIRRQRDRLHRSLRGLQREGFRRVHVLRSAEEVAAAEIVRTPLWTDRRTETGPFDVIGDVHGCHDELVALLIALGYKMDDAGRDAAHPDGRRAVFVGDYGDRGPATPAVLELVMNMVDGGAAIALPGNHDVKLARALAGRKVRVAHGLAESLEQLEAAPPELRDRAREFLEGLISHVVLDEGKLVVAHAGLRESYHGRSSGRVRDFALYGDTTGETDDLGLPVRLDWAADYRGRAAVVYGHTPVATPRWVNDTINIDTGCVFGGALTALRWPERELVAVPAVRQYYEPVRPLPVAGEGDGAARDPFVLDVEDVAGKRVITTRLARTVTIREEQATAAMEVMSRFAIDPRWLVHLPPTMAPPATSRRPGLLEHPAEAFAEYRTEGVPEVVCEEKHMGSRAIVVLCRDAGVARERFGVDSGASGAIHTRTGRAFFDDDATTEAALDRVRAAADGAGLWDALGGTGWVVLDAELLPWSAKAQQLIEHQYAPVGATGDASLRAATAVLERAAASGLDVAELAAR